MDTLNLIQSLQSLKTNGRIVTTVYLDLSNTEKLRNAETVLGNMFRYKKEKTFYRELTAEDKESVRQDIEGILKYITNQFTVEKRSLKIVSSHASYIWKVLHLGIPIDNMLVIQDRPYIRPLLQSLSDQRNFGIVLVDQGKAKIFENRLAYVNELWSAVNLLPEGRFDAVVCFEFLEHIHEAEDVLRKFGELSDILICSTPNEEVRPHKQPPVNEFHVRHYTPGEFENLLAIGGYEVRHWFAQLNGSNPELIPGTDGKFIIAVAAKSGIS